MRAVLLLAGAVLLCAASPPRRGISLQLQSVQGLPQPAPGRLLAPPSAFEPAPLPNRDVDAPAGPRASYDPEFSPELFSRHGTYRGEGFSPGSSADGPQEKDSRPAAGFNITMPFKPD